MNGPNNVVVIHFDLLDQKAKLEIRNLLSPSPPEGATLGEFQSLYDKTRPGDAPWVRGRK
jgi:hypothetical protein